MQEYKIQNKSFKLVIVGGFLLFSNLVASIATAATATVIPLVNSGFESAWTGGVYNAGSYVYKPTGQNLGWTFSGMSGVSVSNSAWGGVAQEGHQFAFLQAYPQTWNGISSSGSISQSFTVASSSDVKTSFEVAARSGSSAQQQVAVSVDGHVLGTFAATNTSWVLDNLDLGVLAAGVHSISFSNTYVGQQDTSIFLDKISLASTAAVPEPEEWAMLLFGFPLLGWAARSKSA